MAKLRLNQGHRDRLRKLVRDVVTPPKSATDLTDTAHAKAAELVRKFLSRKYPPQDMEVLARYKAASKDMCIDFARGENGVRRFRFRDNDDVPLIPDASHTRYIKPYAPTAVITLALDDLERAEQALKTATEKTRAPYLSLIEFQAKTFEDVVEVWPEAAQLRSEFMAPPLPVPISAVKDRIAADMARRAREAPPIAA